MSDRKIATILSADVVGYSRLMETDDEATLSALKQRREIFQRLVEQHGGQEFGSVGDSLMAQFPSAVNALRAARAIQGEIESENEGLASDRRMQLRIGINLGDVIEEDGTLYGDGVNIAARLQALAPPGGIWIADSVYAQVHKRLDLNYQYAGEQRVKNIAELIEAFKVLDGKATSFNVLIAELHRRRVFASGLLYCFAAWLILQFAAQVIVQLDAPQSFLRPLAIILVLGFAPALVLGWRYDITTNGVRHSRPNPTSDRLLRSWQTAPLLAVVPLVFMLPMIWLVASVKPDLLTWPIGPGDGREVKSIAVTPMQNLTGDSDLDWLGSGLSNLVRDRLAQSRHIAVVSQQRWQSLRRAARDGTDIVEIAWQADIDFVLSGEIMSSPSGLILTQRVTDAATGTDVVARSIEELSSEQVLGLADRVALLSKQGMRVPYTEQVDTFAADFAVEHLAAYRAYVDALEPFQQLRFDEAEQLLKTAIQLAPDFHIARYRLAFVQWATSRRREAAMTLARIPPDAPVTRRERLYIDAGKAFFADYDLDRAAALYRELLAEWPYEVEARQFLAEVLHHDHKSDAAIAELRKLARQEPENEAVWSVLAIVLTETGRLDEAEVAARNFRRLAPDRPEPLARLGEIRSQSGDFSGAIEAFGRALQLDPGFAWATHGLARVYAIQGDFEGAEALWTALLADSRAEPEHRIGAALDRASVFRARGRCREVIAMLSSLDGAIRDEVARYGLALELRGKCQMDLGNEAEALRLFDAAIAAAPSVPTGYLFAKGMARLRAGDLDAVGVIANLIRGYALAPDDPDRTEEKAAAYLDGWVQLAAGNSMDAARYFRQSIDTAGYRYAIYEVGLARALRASGEFTEARALAAKARVSYDPGDPRLDLEADRARAHWLEIELADELGAAADAAALRKSYADRWGKPAAIIAASPIN